MNSIHPIIYSTPLASKRIQDLHIERTYTSCLLIIPAQIQDIHQFCFNTPKSPRPPALWVHHLGVRTILQSIFKHIDKNTKR